jgi:hypothetical protein
MTGKARARPRWFPGNFKEVGAAVLDEAIATGGH